MLGVQPSATPRDLGSPYGHRVGRARSGSPPGLPDGGEPPGQPVRRARLRTSASYSWASRSVSSMTPSLSRPPFSHWKMPVVGRI